MDLTSLTAKGIPVKTLQDFDFMMKARVENLG